MMKRFTNQSHGSQAGRMYNGGAKFCKFALFPLMLLMLLLLPANMVAQTEASSSKYIATYESSTQTLTFKENVGETLPSNSVVVEDKMKVADIKRNFENGTIVHIVFDKSFSTYAPTSLSSFFGSLTKLETITGLEYLNTANVTDMSYMFSGCSKLTSLDVTHFNTANVTNMCYMFSSCLMLTSLDVTKFNTENVTNMNKMFYGCSKLTSLDVTHFNTTNVTNMGYMFSGCSKLTSLDVTHFNTANVTNMVYMFSDCSKLTSLDVTKLNTAKVMYMRYMFSGCSALISLDVTKFNTGNVTNMSYMFYGCSKLTSLDVTKFNTGNVTNMRYMFSGCSALISLDVTKFNTGNVTDMNKMFYGCSKLTSLDLTHFNTTNVTNMNKMFYGCNALTSLDVTKFNTANVTDMGLMFYRCSKLTSLDVTHFNTANVTNMYKMFYDCEALTSLDVTKFNTGNVTNMSYMFFHCAALTSLDITKFNTANVTNMEYMFSGCSKLTSLDVTNFNTENVTNMSYMFNNCGTLTTIYVSDKFVTDKVTKGSYMFDNCTNLKGFIEYKKNPSQKDHNYANYKTGYFTKLVAKNGDERYCITGETTLFTAENLTLADDKDFVAYEPFAAKAASYSRTINAGTKWATLCLPFEVSLANQNFRAFKLLSADEGTETVELEEIEGSIAAGTPVIIKMKDGATKLDFTVANKEIAKDVQTAETANGNYQLQGLYTQKMFSKDADNNCYIVKGDKLMNPAKLLDKTTTESVGSKPFRAYMVDNSSAPAAGARMFSISVGGSTTAIEQLETTADSKAEYYDLQGRRLQNLQKGVNIVKRGGKTMKVIIK